MPVRKSSGHGRHGCPLRMQHAAVTRVREQRTSPAMGGGESLEEYLVRLGGIARLAEGESWWRAEKSKGGMPRLSSRPVTKIANFVAGLIFSASMLNWNKCQTNHSTTSHT